MKQYLLLLARAALAASIAASGIVSVASATEADRREAAAAPNARAASAATVAPKSSGNELERLGWEAALIDSSLFGQLRILRNVKPRMIDTPSNTGTTEACR